MGNIYERSFDTSGISFRRERARKKERWENRMEERKEGGEKKEKEKKEKRIKISNSPGARKISTHSFK